SLRIVLKHSPPPPDLPSFPTRRSSDLDGSSCQPGETHADGRSQRNYHTMSIHYSSPLVYAITPALPASSVLDQTAPTATGSRLAIHCQKLYLAEMVR